MKTAAELRRELGRAEEKERLEKANCTSCDGKGWYCDTTYNRSGDDVACGRCHGTGLPDEKVAEIIAEAFRPYRKPVGRRIPTETSGGAE